MGSTQEIRRIWYKVRNVKLNGNPDEIAAKCRELTRELLLWWDGTPKVQLGTWAWAIARYKGDDFSPFHDVKDNTRAGYRYCIDKWGEAIGKLEVQATDFETLMIIKRGMEKKSRSDAYVKRMFAHLRIVANYGLAIEPELFRNICDVMRSGALKTRNPRPRDVAPTASQIRAIIAAADAANDVSFALGLSLQWWLTLRAVDVRGQWLGTGKTRRWADGLTWDGVDLTAGTIRKMISKTERHEEREMVWNLGPVPDLLLRLNAIPEAQRVGPVIKKADGQPYEVRHYRDLFRRYAIAAGVPEEVKLMDTRAGAITEAASLGANQIELQHAANHRDFKTTDRYIRSREAGANSVIGLRAKAAAREHGRQLCT